MTKFFTIIADCAVFLASDVAPAATITTFVYDVGTEVGASGTLMSTDGWAGEDIGDWIAGGTSPNAYARNSGTTDVDSITRANDAGFSFAIPENALFVSLEIRGRVTDVGFWQGGLTDGTSQVFGVGANFGGSQNDDKFFLLDNGARIKEAGASNTPGGGSVFWTLRLDYDLVAATADLVLNDSSTLINDYAMTMTASQLANTDGLFARSGTQFAGPGIFTISVTTPIPEPSTLLLLTSGLMRLGMRRRRPDR